MLKRLEAEFVARWFRHWRVTAFPVIHARLTAYLTSTDADVWLITGSPQSLVEQVYRDTLSVAAGESDSQPHRAPLGRLVVKS